ncbi:hypothetical protein FQZ97_1075180 [compost metagenome]
MPVLEGLAGGQNAADATFLQLLFDLQVVFDLGIEAGNDVADVFTLADHVQPVEQSPRTRSGEGDQVGRIGVIAALPVQAALQRIVGKTDRAQPGKLAAQAGDNGSSGLGVLPAVHAGDRHAALDRAHGRTFTLRAAVRACLETARCCAHARPSWSRSDCGPSNPSETIWLSSNSTSRAALAGSMP